MKFCPYCGADLLKEDAAFCAECGKQLSAAEEVPSPVSDTSNQHSAQPNEQKAPKIDSKKRKKPKQKKEKAQESPSPKLMGNLSMMDMTAIITMFCLRIWIGKKRASITS